MVFLTSSKCPSELFIILPPEVFKNYFIKIKFPLFPRRFNQALEQCHPAHPTSASTNCRRHRHTHHRTPHCTPNTITHTLLLRHAIQTESGEQIMEGGLARSADKMFQHFYSAFNTLVGTNGERFRVGDRIQLVRFVQCYAFPSLFFGAISCLFCLFVSLLLSLSLSLSLSLPSAATPASTSASPSARVSACLFSMFAPLFSQHHHTKMGLAFYSSSPPITTLRKMTPPQPPPPPSLQSNATTRKHYSVINGDEVGEVTKDDGSNYMPYVRPYR